MQHHGICCLPRKNTELPVFFATFIYNSRFFGLLFNFTVYKTIKSSRCKLWFCALAPLSKLDMIICVLIALFFNNSDLF